MAPNPRVLQAFRAMRNIGIPEEKVKPVLKNLLKLYEKKWELIEEENYRALADAIFEAEETEAEENKKKLENTERHKVFEEEAQVYDEPERPLKRLRLRHQEGQSSTSFGNSSPGLGGSPRVEGTELPETFPQHESRGTAAPQPSSENTRAESQPVSPQLITRNRGKQPVSPRSLALQERSDQPDVTMRTEANSVSSPRRLSNKGKEPLVPQNPPKEKIILTERSSHGVRFKEPKLEPGLIRVSKQKAPVTRALIKPKDEPITDELPIAVIHPEPLSNGNSSLGNGSTGEPHGRDTEPVASQSKDGKDKTDGIPTSSSEPRTNCELANIHDEPAANLEIASSPLGEVKISLSCNSASGRPDFHMPSLDAVVKAVEDKCLKSYKVIDPNFSVKKLMKDMCECFLELGTDSNNESQETINVTPTIDLLQNCAADAVGDNDMALCPTSEPVDIQCDADMALAQIPRLPSPSNGMNGCIEPEKKSSANDGESENGGKTFEMEHNIQKDISGNDGETDQEMEHNIEKGISGIDGETTDKEMEHNGLDHTSSENLVVIKQLQLAPANIKSVDDIAKGQEKVTISLINEINGDSPQSFHYIPQNVVFQSACVSFSLARIRDDNCCPTCDGDCLLLPTPCACALETDGGFMYTLEGLVKEEFLDECVSLTREPQKHSLFYCKECPLEILKNEEMLEPCKGHLGRKFIRECWWKCGCSKQCGNRVVQRGINRNLQVFMTPGGKGWGLRSLEDLPKGAFVCEYVGEVLTNKELYDRVSKSPKNEEQSYPVLLDADWGSGVLKDEKALCLDATDFGNVARFINHRCFDSNLVEIPVEVETPDHHYYHVALFTTRKVAALEELTWDYGIDFDDQDHPIKAFQCCCGSKFCRNMKRSSRSRSSARI